MCGVVILSTVFLFASFFLFCFFTALATFTVITQLVDAGNADCGKLSFYIYIITEVNVILSVCLNPVLVEAAILSFITGGWVSFRVDVPAGSCIDENILQLSTLWLVATLLQCSVSFAWHWLDFQCPVPSPSNAQGFVLGASYTSAWKTFIMPKSRGCSMLVAFGG